MIDHEKLQKRTSLGLCGWGSHCCPRCGVEIRAPLRLRMPSERTLISVVAENLRRSVRKRHTLFPGIRWFHLSGRLVVWTFSIPPNSAVLKRGTFSTATPVYNSCEIRGWRFAFLRHGASVFRAGALGGTSLSTTLHAGI